MKIFAKFLQSVVLCCGIALSLSAPDVLAQCVGCGSEYNKADRRSAELQRLTNYDKPLRSDPLGNALISGGVSGAVRGSAAAVRSLVSGTTFGATTREYHDRRKNKR